MNQHQRNQFISSHEKLDPPEEQEQLTECCGRKYCNCDEERDGY